MYCTNCGQSFEGKFCPKCGTALTDAAPPVQNPTPPAYPASSNQNPVPPAYPTPPNQPQNTPQKPKKKKKLLIFFLIATVLLIIIVIAALNSSDTTDTPDPTPQSAATTEAPTAHEMFYSISLTSTVEYTISDAAGAFLDAHEDLFPAKSSSVADPYTDYSISYKHLAKKAADYGDKLMFVSAYVVQIEEITVSGKTVSVLNIIDDNTDQYYVYYLGSLDDVFEDDSIGVHGLAMDMSYFDNTDGGQTLVPVLAGSYIQKY